MVSGNTEVGIEQRFLRREYPIIICPSNVPVSVNSKSNRILNLVSYYI